jgi:hypothetical protein
MLAKFSTFVLVAGAQLDDGRGNKELLRHSRGERPHSRGCWVLDLVLAKE